jgi:hypothetical protein
VIHVRYRFQRAVVVTPVATALRMVLLVVRTDRLATTLIPSMVEDHKILKILRQDLHQCYCC